MLLQRPLPEGNSAIAASRVHPSEICTMTSIKSELDVPSLVKLQHAREWIAGKEVSVCCDAHWVVCSLTLSGKHPLQTRRSSSRL
jgi:hypothetical protein